LKSIGGNASKYNSGKGSIVDSGTTDTYLPVTLQNQFKKLYLSITKMEYNNNPIELTVEKFSLLPTIVYRLESVGANGSKTFVDIECPPTSYMEAFKGNKYSARIYLTEDSGAVLGANFMNGYNVIFDADNYRIGFAKSNCIYEKNNNKDKKNKTEKKNRNRAIKNKNKQDNTFNEQTAV
jgi:hypothetical protein